MTKNPLINACSATIYISIVAYLMYYGSHFAEPIDAVIMPIAMLSLFVLSAAVMAYIFGFQPVQLFLDGQKKEAANLFLKTLGTFAVVTAIIFLILIFISRST